MTIDEAREAMKAGVRVIFDGFQNYIVSAIIERLQNGKIYYLFEVSELYDKYEYNLTYDKVRRSFNALPHQVSCNEILTKDGLLKWVRENAAYYPALDNFTEETSGDKQIFKITVQYGRYDGLIITFDKATVTALRYREYEVIFVETYEAARRWILECVKWSKNKNKLKRSINNYDN